MKRIVLVLAILAMAASAERERRVLFTVRHAGKETLLDAVVLLDPLEAPPIDNGARADRAPEFIKRYFDPGHTYRVIGGGSIRVISHGDPGGCGDMWAEATTSAGGMLATNDPSLRAHRVETLNAADLRSAKALAADVFAEHRVRQAVTRGDAMWVTVADRAEPLLVGSFDLESADHKMRYGVFVIARRHGGAWRREHVEFHEHVVESLVGMRTFAGNVDLDGDGVDELIVRTEEIEGYHYDILERRRGSWDVIATGGGAGC